MLFLYRILYPIAFILMLPYLLYLNYAQKKKMHILERLFPSPHRACLKRCCVVHAVSVGETQAIAPLVQRFQEAFPNRSIAVTSITHTGHRAAKRLFPEAHCFFLPFDFRFSVRRFFSIIQPELLIISEGDIWPEFLHQAKQQGVRTIVVNGSVSDRTFARLKRIPKIARWRFHEIDCFCVQNQLCADRLQQLGVDLSRISITGSMKADCCVHPLSSDDKEALRTSLGIAKTDTVIVVGSTHDSEEEQICTALLPLVQRRRDIKILIVPRHPERFVAVYSTLSRHFQKVACFSRLDQKDWDILVVDSMGLLCNLYQIACLAIVAGSFTESIGGHNIVEPALTGIPVVVGPYMHSQKALFESAQAYAAVIQVDLDRLCHEVERYISCPHTYSQAVSQVHCWVKDIQGATDRTLHQISLLEPVQNLQIN